MLDISQTLKLHAAWLAGQSEGKRANLRDADLCSANLRGANLRDADLCSANLRGADLQDADLQGANLRDANLQDADLQDADLQDANLQDANLRDADLRSANLRGADLRSTSLQGADLRSANLQNTRNIILGPQRSDGYLFWLTRDGSNNVIVCAGCRTFSIADAREHWTVTRSGTSLGTETTTILDYLEARSTSGAML